MRLASLFFVAAVLWVSSSFSEDAPKPELPSKKASIVLPLLRKIAKKNPSPDDIWYDIQKKILGNAQGGFAGGDISRFWATFDYWLDDGTKIEIGITSNCLKTPPELMGIAIDAKYPDGKSEEIYHRQKKESK